MTVTPPSESSATFASFGPADIAGEIASNIEAGTVVESVIEGAAEIAMLLLK